MSGAGISRISRIRGALTPGEWARAAAMTAAVIGLHVIGWGALLAIVVPHHYSIGTQTFGVGIGLTAYTLGARHAFDADHISAIDNTTRKLMADGKRPLSVGFWFSLGHSSVVFALSLLLAIGVKAVVGPVKNDGSGLHQVTNLDRHQRLRLLPVRHRRHQHRRPPRHTQGLPGAQAGPLRRERAGEPPERARLRHAVLQEADRLDPHARGRCTGWGCCSASASTPPPRSPSSSWRAPARRAACPGTPSLTLPVLFAAGMSLLDTIDGSFMNFAYGWAFANPVRKVYYNITITGL